MAIDGEATAADGPAPDYCHREAEDRLIEALAHEREKRGGYIDAETVFVALFPLVYGLLTFAYSNALWNPNGVHAAALRVPGAPESWGATFIVLAIFVIWAGLKRHRKAIIVSCLSAAMVYSTFMVIILMAQAAYPRTLGSAAVYMVFALLFLNRARLAWVT